MEFSGVYDKYIVYEFLINDSFPYNYFYIFKSDIKSRNINILFPNTSKIEMVLHECLQKKNVCSFWV